MQLSDVIADAPTTTDAASELFDSLPAVDPEFMIGTWRGAEMPTGHPIDGALAARFTRHLCHVLEDVRRLVL